MIQPLAAASVGERFTIANLLFPIEPSRFFDSFWERQTLFLQRNDRDYYAALFSVRDFDSLAYFSRALFPDAEQKREFEATKFIRAITPGLDHPRTYHGADLAKLRKLFSEGKTLIINHLQLRWPALAFFNRGLEEIFQCSVNTNCYLTPERAQGFEAHYDDHDVFILQIEGEKDWKLYGAPEPLPLRDERLKLSREQLGKPTEEIRLKPGDLLYLPRGVVHEASTAHALSLHLTVGISINRWADLLAVALEMASWDDKRFRESLPIGSLGNKPPLEMIRERFDTLLRHLAEQSRAENVLEEFARRYFDSHLPALPDGKFGADHRRAAVDLDTVLERSPGVLIRVSRDGDAVLLQFPGGTISAPAVVEPALHFIAAHDRFSVGALPDVLSSKSKIVLARRLIKEGLLAIVYPLADDGPS